jgi:alpha-tubulin suppressor-like RCC1 family protein
MVMIVRGRSSAWTNSCVVPVPVKNLSDVAAIACGQRHSLAVRKDGTVWAWGKNVDGQLGDGSITQRTTPVQVSLPAGVTPTAVAAIATATRPRTTKEGRNDRMATSGATFALVSVVPRG